MPLVSRVLDGDERWDLNDCSKGAVVQPRLPRCLVLSLSRLQLEEARGKSEFTFLKVPICGHDTWMEIREPCSASLPSGMMLRGQVQSCKALMFNVSQTELSLLAAKNADMLAYCHQHNLNNSTWGEKQCKHSTCTAQLFHCTYGKNNICS